MNNVIEFLKSKLSNEDTVIVACSGGPDSMCLLDIVKSVTNNIVVACVNHNVRESSKEEFEYVKGFANKNNLKFEGLELTFNTLANFECNARNKRYEFLNELLEKYHGKYILTAHHGDDLIETILMRLTRGSKLSGYIGIKKENNKYLRPLLYVTKKDIIEYLNNNQIKYFIDETNNSDEHQRNRYRKNIIPFLKKEDKNIHLKYLKFSEELEEYDDFINGYIKKLNVIKSNTVNLDILKKEKPFIRRKTIEYLIKDIQKNDILEINDNTLMEILKLMESKKSNAKINLNNGYVAQKKYNEFVIKKELLQDNYSIEFDDYFENDEYIIHKVSNYDGNSNNVLRLDLSKVKLPLIIRTRKTGDKMQVKNLGTKKVKDILINEKIDIDKRNNIPIVIDSKNNILWLPGIKKSKFDVGKNEKYDIILLCERK